jgi:hypothetical protein
MSLDSSIFISQLTDDVHAEAVFTALMVLETLRAELTLPLLCYAELWTGVELLPEEERPVAVETLEHVLRASQSSWWRITWRLLVRRPGPKPPIAGGVGGVAPHSPLQGQTQVLAAPGITRRRQRMLAGPCRLGALCITIVCVRMLLGGA